MLEHATNQSRLLINTFDAIHEPAMVKAKTTLDQAVYFDRACSLLKK